MLLWARARGSGRLRYWGLVFTRLSLLMMLARMFRQRFLRRRGLLGRYRARVRAVFRFVSRSIYAMWRRAMSGGRRKSRARKTEAPRMMSARILSFLCVARVWTKSAASTVRQSHAVASTGAIGSARASVRIVDALGHVANAGLLQLRVGEDFGAVCGLNDGAATVVCRLAGYDYGVVGSSPCSSYGGSSLCGAPR